MSYLGREDFLVEVRTLRIQAPHHRPEHAHFHSCIWKAIHGYLLCNGLLRLMVGLCTSPVRGATKVCRMRAVLPRVSFFSGVETGSLWVGKSSPLASNLVARAAVAAMSWEVVMLWDRIWLEV